MPVKANQTESNTGGRGGGLFSDTIAVRKEVKMNDNNENDCEMRKKSQVEDTRELTTLVQTDR